MKTLRLNSSTWGEITPESKEYLSNMFYTSAHKTIQNAIHELTNLERMTTDGSFDLMNDGQLESLRLELDDLFESYERLIKAI